MSQEEVVERARLSFQTGRSKPLEFRLQQLRRLQSFIKERQEDIKDALQKDLGKNFIFEMLGLLGLIFGSPSYIWKDI
uniref:aldehyde dehydrogenase (NAD(+)) n=1 Tax=Poecilia reticulata TaxID=8081 RepID=A0A3P9PMY2_POERE